MDQDSIKKGYVGAPYNFVPLHGKVYKAYKTISDLPGHDDLCADRMSGEVTIEITAETPVCISRGKDGNDGFFKNFEGKYAIPGSTLRGLIRGNMQILGFGAVGEDIDDSLYLYRAITAGKQDDNGSSNDTGRRKIKENYGTVLGVKSIRKGEKTISVTGNVKAGYISNENGKFLIYPSIVKKIENRGELNYYIVRETEVADRANRASSDPQTENDFSALYWDANERVILRYSKYDESDRTRGRKGTKKYKNNLYVPYYKPVLYWLKNEQTVVKVKEPMRTEKMGDYHEGYAMSTGPMENTKAIYIIPKIDITEKPYEIPESDIVSYKMDYAAKEKLLGSTVNLDDSKKKEALKEATKSFFSLPEAGETRPVFYINHGGRYYFGYSPYLRLFYNKSTRDAVPEAHKDTAIIDYPRALFGMTTGKDNEGQQNNSGSYKSRLSFEDATIQNSGAESSTTVVLGGPKTSSFMDYLKNGSTYNDEDARINGIKQYWLRKELYWPESNDNTNVETTINAIGAGAVFRGRIRFKNLSDDELGLLLWCIDLEKGCKQNIGMGKPLGYGRVDIKATKIMVYGRSSFSIDEPCISLKPMTDITDRKGELIEQYKDKIEKCFELKKPLMKINSISAFFGMKKCFPDPNEIRYMQLKEYQSRTAYLKTASEMVKELKKTEAEQKAKEAEEAMPMDEKLKLLQGKYAKPNRSNNSGRGSK